MITNKIDLVHKVSHLIHSTTHISKKQAKTIYMLFTNYLSDNPYDTQVWIKFALVLSGVLKNPLQAIDCLYSVLRYQTNNITATMLLAAIAEQDGSISDDIFEKLCTLQTANKELLSLIEYQKAWYYLEKNENLYCYSLEHSLELCNKFVWNYKALGSIYLFNNKIAIAKEFFKKAIGNIHQVYSHQEYKYFGAMNSDDFFNAHLKGTHIMQPTVVMMIKVIEQ